MNVSNAFPNCYSILYIDTSNRQNNLTMVGQCHQYMARVMFKGDVRNIYNLCHNICASLIMTVMYCG